MEKSLRLFALLFFAAILAACNSNNGDAASTVDTPSPAPEVTTTVPMEAADAPPEPEIPALPLNAHMAQAYQDDLPGLLEKNYIRVLTTLNRTNFFISEGHLVGYEYSLLKDYETYLNKKPRNNNLKIVLEFIPVARDELLPKLVDGYGDIAAAGLTVTDERKQKVDFTKPYLLNVKEIVVSNKRNVQLQNLNDLCGKKVYVRKSSSYYESLTQWNKKLTKEQKPPVNIIILSEELETESILEMVDSGAIDITVADSHIANVWSKVLKNLEIHENMVLRKGSKIAWMVRKNNPELKSSLNAFLKTHKKGTLLGNIYFNRYFEQIDKLKNPSELDEWKKVKQYKTVMQKYGEKYDVDWLLILAQAFQESGLDQSRKSNAGAVGIMQVLPSTAKDKKIGIENIEELDNNVHAGVKYLAFLRDRYFNSSEIRTRDQIRLALAAYNAGPAKIQRARNLAKKMGLDENQWFRNVELAVLRIVGQETVRYVSNINKYYVLYQTLLEQNQ